MPSLPCPSCGRALNLTEGLRGALVQCPACRHTFEAPEEVPPHRPPQATPATRPAPPPGAPDEPAFDVPRWREGPAPEGGPQKALRSAVWWLRAAVLVDFCTSVVHCCTLPVLTRNYGADFWSCGTFLVAYIPLVVVALGAPELQARRSRRMAQAAAVLVLPPSLWALLQAWVAGRAALTDLAQGEPPGLFYLGLAAVTLFGAAAGVTGSVKAFALLSNPEIRNSFR